MYSIIHALTRECVSDRGQVLAFTTKDNARAYLKLYLNDQYEIVNYCPNVSVRIVSMDYTLVKLLAG